MPVIEVIDDERGFAALCPEWTQLLTSSRADCLFLTWEWLHTWWSHLGEGRSLFIVTVRHGGKLIALAPLTISRVWPRTCEFLGIGSVGSDYLDVIVDSGYEGTAVDVLGEFLVDCGFSLRLPSVKPDSVVASALGGNLSAGGWQFRKVAMQVCPYIALPSTWDAYLGALGPNHRYNFKRRLRNLEKNHAVRFERAESEEECTAALQDVIRLHLKRWSARGGSDGFHQERLLAFHREFSLIAREMGWLRLRLMTIDGHPAGAFYGFRYRDEYLFYQSGFDESFLRHSVGLVMLGLTIKEAIEEGAAEYDFLHGDESYKFLWATEVRPLFRMEFYPPGVFGSMHRNSVAAIAATKKIVRRALDAPLTR